MSTPNYTDWIRFHGTFKADKDKKVSGVEFQIEAKDTVSSTNGIDRVPVYFSDLQFQSGEQLTGWVPNTRELLKKLSWTNDENQMVATPNRMEGTPPAIRTDIEKRWFNVTGRGHETFVLPNYFLGDLSIPILPTGIEIVLRPKDDFDFLRVSTSFGVELDESKQFYKQDGGIYREIEAKYAAALELVPTTNAEYSRKNREIWNWENVVNPLFSNHPLHTRYTREFWVDGTTAGTEIRIDAITRTATVGGIVVPIVGENSMDVDGEAFPIDRKKFIVAPKGTATVRIEFYKKVDYEIITYDADENFDYHKTKKTFTCLKDTGIGYSGTAGFNQWTHGLSKI